MNETTMYKFMVESKSYESEEKEISCGRIFAIARIPNDYNLYRVGDAEDYLISWRDQEIDIDGARFYALPKAAFA